MTKKQILDKLNILPKGAISKKTIKRNDKSYEYNVLQWTEEGKQKTRNIKPDELDTVLSQLDERKKLERMLITGEYEQDITLSFFTTVKVGNELRLLVNSVKGLKKRNGYKDISDYLYNNVYKKVFILYGLRRTGKTTLIHQSIYDMNDDDFNKAAFIQITKQDKFSDLNKDLKTLQSNGYKYNFIDEITFMDDFIEGAALLSDIYSSSGMKIILSGKDSLGFWITKSNELYDRSILLHTTYISYFEFSKVLGIKGIDNYIQCGGTMSISGHYYNAFDNKENTDEYVDSAIAQNIQHSLKYYKYEGYFRHLYDLYEKGELTGAINRVVEDMNHRFTIEVLEREFKSNDLRISANNLRKDRNMPTTILDDIDIYTFTNRLKELLEIKNKDEQSIKIDEVHIKQIEEYLSALDLIDTIRIVDSNTSRQDRKRVVFTQPGLRYSQAKSFILSLSEDMLFKNLSIEDRNRVVERILNEIKGRMTEDIVLLGTKIAKPSMDVFKLQFADGEFDMVISDPDKMESEVYEIKYSKDAVKDQARHLLNKEKCDETEYRFGHIRKKVVLYRGESKTIEGIEYQNIEEYLKQF
ncbi:MAG: AAA family ATPase [Acholeplasmatales bacterium]|nr:AAA family ATPase [Acholeplasmatales bacterium]